MTDHSRPLPRSSSFKWLLPVAAASILGLAGCPSPVDWSDYEGVNLIGDRQLSATDASGKSLWYFADGLRAGTTNATTGVEAPTDFVSLELVEAGGAPSLPSGVAGPIYRYEVRNLFPHGDFEGIAPGSFGSVWNPETPEGGAIGIDETDPIAGARSLLIDTDAAIEQVWIDLGEHLEGGFSAGMTPLPTFAVNLDFRSSTVFPLRLESASEDSVIWTIDVPRGDQSVAQVFSYPGRFSENFAQTAPINTVTPDPAVPGATRLRIGGDSTLDTTLDRITMVRADQSHYLRLSVPYVSDERPEIIAGGSYALRFWVAPDPTAGSNNRMAARAISAGIDTNTSGQIGPRGTPVLTRDISADHRIVTDLEGWEQLTFELYPAVGSPPVTAERDTIAFDVVIEIGNSSLGPAGQDAGSILIAAPELDWRP